MTSGFPSAKGHGMTRTLCAASVCIVLATVPSIALYAPEYGATWATNVNDLGIEGTPVGFGFVEADGDGVAGAPYVYRINPDPTNGWEGRYYIGGHFTGKTFTHYDDPATRSTNYSGHATGIGINGMGNYVGGEAAWWGIALGATNIGCYEANHFIDNYLASTLAPDHKVLSLAFTTVTNTQTTLASQMDDLVDTHGVIAVQGVRPRPAPADHGGDHPAGMGAAYNIITVGQCTSTYTNYGTSQYGPSRDFGTAKPDLLSGNISESEATARGAGSACLIVEHALAKGWSNGTDPRVVKAIMMAGARKTHGWDKGVDGTNDDHYVPSDYNAGAGILHCLNNFGIVYGGEAAVSSVNNRAAWDLGTVSANQTNVYYVDVPQTNIYLSTTLAWNRHVGGTPELKDLNLRLYSATGTALGAELDWSTSTVDSVDHIWYLIGCTGRYAIAVDGNLITGNETYGIAWSLTGHTNTALLDADADGVGDAYEMAHFQEIYFYVGTNDPDNDGADNHHEYVADTQPTNLASLFTASIERASGGTVVLSFQSSTGRVYDAEYNDHYYTNMSMWAVATVSPFRGNGGATNWIDDGTETPSHPTSTTHRAYRLRVTAP